MGAGGHEINKAIQDCIADQGFWQELPVDLNDIRSATGDLPTTASPNSATAPLPVLTSDMLTLSVAAGASSTFYLAFRLPAEAAAYAPTGDTTAPYPALRVGLSLFMAGTPTNTPIITVTAKAYPQNRAGASAGVVKATYTAVYRAPFDGSVPTSAAVANITTPLEYVWDFTGVLSSSGSYKLEAGDWIVVKFAVATHTTDAMTIAGAFARARLNAALNTIQGTGNLSR